MPQEITESRREEALRKQREAKQRARIDKPYARVYRCRRASCEDERGCKKCQIYRCPGCQYLRHWSDGGTDSELCDACHHVVCEAFQELFS